MLSTPDHEKLFEEICGKLSELSQHQQQEKPVSQPNQALEKVQSQIRKFQSEMLETHTELHGKIKNIENVQFTQNDLALQLKQVTEQLNQERTNNTKLNTDLAKSLELSLQLQLEIQGLRARSQQFQNEEKKYSQSLMDKIKQLGRDLELLKALKDEAEQEFSKARASFIEQNETWKTERQELQNEIANGKEQVEAVLKMREQLQAEGEAKDATIQSLNEEIEKMSQGLTELEGSTQKQNEVLKNLMDVAEQKIVEMKMALDKKNLECQDYYSHLQQSLTQVSLFKQENAHLKDYIAKINQHLQQGAEKAIANEKPVPLAN